MPEKSKLNSKLGKVSEISLFVYGKQAGDDPHALVNVNGKEYLGTGYSNIRPRYWFKTTTTGNSDSVSVKLGFKQPKTPKDPYQIQYRWHARWTPAYAKKKGASWTSWSSWKNLKAMDGIPVGSTTNADEWLKPNLGQNSKSSYVDVCDLYITFKALTGNATPTSFVGTSLVNHDAVSYQFRVRTYNIKTKKHGDWVYSEGLRVYKAPRVANLTAFVDDSGGLILKCNIRYGERKGIFHFTDIRDLSDAGIVGASADVKIYRSILKMAPLDIKMTYDSSRLTTSVPPRRDGFVPASCRIPLSSLKRAISHGESLYFSPANTFIGNDDSGTAVLVQNASQTGSKIIGNIRFIRITVSRKDITINKPKLVLKKATDKPYVQAWLYKTDADDTVESVGTCLQYKYEGKLYSIKPTYTKLSLNVNNTRNAIAYWIFTSVPLGIKLTVGARASNSYGSSKKVENAITLPSEFWYIQKEGNLSILAVLQWNVKIKTRSNPKYTMELPYGRSKPFVAYGNGIAKTYDVSGEVPTKTQNPLFNKTYATKVAWTKVQNTPGIYVVRGPYGVVYRIAITEVTLEQDDKTEILKVSFSGTEIE